MMRTKHDSSITAKLRWMNLLMSAAVLLLACAAFVTYGTVKFRQNMGKNLGIQAQIIAFNSISPLLFNDQSSAQKILHALQASPNILDAEIYTPDKRSFARYSRDRKTQAVSLPAIPNGQKEAQWFRQGELVAVRQICFQGKFVGAVVIRSDLREAKKSLKGYAVILAAVLATGLVAVLLISPVVQKDVAEPIVRLAETARIVSQAKDYSIRIPASGRRDELGFLTDSFNEMLEQIQDRDAALRRAHSALEQQVEERTAEFYAASKELEAFSYSVSHDLRAPLRQINGFAGILADEYGSKFDDSGQRYLKLIQDGARNMGQLVDDLIHMGKIGRQELTRKSTDLNSLLQNVLEDLKPELEGREIDWRIGPLPTLECDPALMKQVLASLLSNAVKYTRRRKHPVIEMGQITRDNESVIFVHDNGAGFDQRYAHKLFGVFQRLHRAEEFEGTGVGLAIVQRILQKHGGRIWAEGEPGKGATFFFTLKATNRHSQL